MRQILLLLIVAALAVPSAASGPSCEPVGVVEIVNSRLFAVVYSDDHPQAATPVSLYSGNKLVAKTKTNEKGFFVFDHLVSGRYQLVIDRFGNIHGLGSFEIFDLEVKPTFNQQVNYVFGRTRDGCLHWGMSTN